MLLQDGRYRMGQSQYRRQRGGYGRDQGLANARRRGAYQDDLVLEGLRLDLPGVHIKERINTERRPVILILIKIRKHLQGRIGRDAQFANLHPLAQSDLDVFGSKIEALRDQHHRQRRVVLIEKLQHQRFGAGSAVDIRF